MNTLRIALSTITVVLLLAGYIASQFIYLSQGDVSAYAARVDQPPIRALAALLLIAAVVLSVVREGNKNVSDR
jgi:uncharacterized protein HemY